MVMKNILEEKKWGWSDFHRVINTSFIKRNFLQSSLLCGVQNAAVIGKNCLHLSTKCQDDYKHIATLWLWKESLNHRKAAIKRSKMNAYLKFYIIIMKCVGRCEGVFQQSFVFVFIHGCFNMLMMMSFLCQVLWAVLGCKTFENGINWVVFQVAQLFSLTFCWIIIIKTLWTNIQSNFKRKNMQFPSNPHRPWYYNDV